MVTVELLFHFREEVEVKREPSQENRVSPQGIAAMATVDVCAGALFRWKNTPFVNFPCRIWLIFSRS